ncbi:MAG: hypothetical protein CBB65_06790 [Hyphomonadaceae bacterium TMED5]|nr:hypothetical protein [Ponticaulis sp.]OUX99783.1 MAG: hypothetical protein CBB65_06790 [Hyphomonadaceae bacterium TMED5]|tara:strand:+ start:88325 stop:89617 length:1293 start_codon:yes stop_codon:yes gene_type:complete
MRPVAQNIQHAEKTGIIRSYVEQKSGNTVILFAVLLPLLVGSLALVADFGLWRQSAQRLQLFADTAAVAAAHETYLTDDPAELNFIALGMLHENGLDISDATIAVHSPPVSGRYVGEEGVQVIVTQTQEQFFSSIFMGGAIDISREAVAVIVEPGEPLCVLALDEMADGGLEISGTADVGVSQCAVQANSSHANGVDMNGSATLFAACVYSAGGVNNPENISMSLCSAPKTGWRTASDPYRSVDVPAGIASMPCQTQSHGPRNSTILTSGRYCADISSNRTVQLEAGGTFIFDAAVLTLRSANAELIGENITIFFVNGGNIELPNGGLVDLTAKTSGEYFGVLMFGDRETQPTDLNVRLIGQADSRLEGALYFPNQVVTYVGGSSSDSGCTHLIAREVELTGNSSFTNANCAALGVREILGRSGVLLSSS